MSVESDADLMTSEQLAEAIDDRLGHVRILGQFVLSIMGRRNIGFPAALGLRTGLRDLIDAERHFTMVASILRGDCCDEHSHTHDNSE
jgi:predicted Rdx family selenoprotein